MIRATLFIFAVALALCSSISIADALTYNVQVQNAASEPSISGKDFLQNTTDTIFDYSYNPAAWTSSSSSGAANQPKQQQKQQTCLLVRNQDRNKHPNALGPVTPSKLAISCRDAESPSPSSNNKFSPITNRSVVFQPTSSFDVLGTEDPRVRVVGNMLTMMYTAVSKNKWGGATARLSMATVPEDQAHDPKKWINHGQLFPDDPNGFQFTKSGALVFDEATPQVKPFLIYGDCTIVNGLQVAIPDAWPPTKWTVPADFLFIKKRERMFDSELVEAGPPPLKLKSGDWLFLYNGAQRLYGVPNKLLYNFGYVIINGTDPFSVIQRSSQPLMQPTRIWQTTGLTPMVVFVEGMVRAPSSSTDPVNSQRFRVFFGAGDTNVGEAEILVSW